MNTKPYHLFDSSGFYTQTCEAQECPLTPGMFLSPVNSTDLPLPTLAAQQTAQFVAGAWQVVPDYRGVTVYDQTTGAAQECTTPGPLAAGLGLTKPAAIVAAETRQNNINAIKAQLAALDTQSIRACRTQDATRMAAIEAQCVTLRAQLAAL